MIHLHFSELQRRAVVTKHPKGFTSFNKGLLFAVIWVGLFTLFKLLHFETIL